MSVAFLASAIVATCQPNYSTNWDNAALTNSFINALLGHHEPSIGKLIAPNAMAHNLDANTQAPLASGIDGLPQKVQVSSMIRDDDRVALHISTDDEEAMVILLRFAGGCITAAAS